MSDYVEVLLDLETVSPKTPFKVVDPKDKREKDCEVHFTKNGTECDFFHRTGALIREIGIVFNHSATYDAKWDIIPEPEKWSQESIDYVKKKGHWDPKDPISFPDAFGRICDFFKDLGGKIVLVAHNGDDFDFSVFATHMKRFSLEWPNGFDIKTFDTLQWVRELRKTSDDKSKFASAKLGALYKAHFDEGIKDVHTAIGDCYAMDRLFTYIAGGREEWRKIVKKRSQDMESVCCTFPFRSFCKGKRWQMEFSFA